MIKIVIVRLLVLASFFLVASCGGGDGSGDAPVSSPTLTQQTAAAQQTAEQNPACQLIQPFYIEVGDAGGAIAGVSVGASAPTATTRMYIASGTKWLFGAYVAEVRSGALQSDDLLATRMLSGYVGMGSTDLCDPSDTVSSCNASLNSSKDLTKVNRFSYASGHFQNWGTNVYPALGPMGVVTLTSEFQNKLGPNIPWQFGSPTLAAGAYISASEYAVFLRKILTGDLQIAALLGSSPVCTLPSNACNSDFSPLPFDWHYSIGHWVEDDPAAGDGSFSSAGALGFYPWIDSTKTYYGILAREKLDPNAATQSIECGRLIRKAFRTGTVQ